MARTGSDHSGSDFDRHGTAGPSRAVHHGTGAAIGPAADQTLRLQQIEVPLVDLSSREIRRRISQGRSIRYMLPRPVEVYIAEKGLYRTKPATQP